MPGSGETVNSEIGLAHEATMKKVNVDGDIKNDVWRVGTKTFSIDFFVLYTTKNTIQSARGFFCLLFNGLSITYVTSWGKVRQQFKLLNLVENAVNASQRLVFN